MKRAAAVALLLGAAVCFGVVQFVAARDARHQKELQAATALAEEESVRADSIALTAREQVGIARMQRDSAVRVSDRTRLAAQRTTAALSVQLEAAMVAAGDTSLTADSLRRVIVATVVKANADSVAHATAEGSWMDERGRFASEVTRLEGALKAEQDARLKANVAHMRKVAELEHRISSTRRAGRLEKIGYTLAGAGLCALAC